MAVSNIIERTIDIDSGVIQEDLRRLFAVADAQAHTFKITLVSKGEPVSLSGHTVIGYFMTNYHGTVVINGSLSGNVATLVLPAACYAHNTGFQLIIRLVSGSTKTAIYWGGGYVTRSATEPVIDPGSVVPNIDDLLAKIDQMEQATQAANTAADNANTAASKSIRYDTAQSLTDTQKAQARTNAGVLEPASTAPAYSASSTYAVGDYVTYGGKLYRCSTAITTAEAWTAGHWTEVNVGAEISDLKEDLSNKANVELVDPFVLMNIPMEQGGFIGQGDEGPSTTKNRIRSTTYLPRHPSLNVLFPHGTKHRLVKYNKVNGEYTFDHLTDWSTEITEDLAKSGTGQFFRLLVAFSDDSDITPDGMSYQIASKENVKFPSVIETCAVSGIVNGWSFDANGASLNNAKYAITPLIPVKSGATYKANILRNDGVYDKDLQFIGFNIKSSSTQVTMPEDAAYYSYTINTETDGAVPYFAEETSYREGFYVNNERFDGPLLINEDAGSLGYSNFYQITKKGIYRITSSFCKNAIDAPSGFKDGGYLVVFNDGFYIMQILLMSTAVTRGGTVFYRISPTTSTMENVTFKTNFVQRPAISDVTSFSDYVFSGIVSFTSTVNATDKPFDDNIGLLLNLDFGGRVQVVFGFNSHSVAWRRISANGVAEEWQYLINKNEKKILEGKTIAVIGDSISTNGIATGNYNVPELKIESSDIGIELSAYLTFFDIHPYNDIPPLVINGHAYSDDDIGRQITFTPRNDDVGKEIGKPANYNNPNVKTWWEVVQEELGGTFIPVTWSGASITSHEEDKTASVSVGSGKIYKCSFAWHDSQIRKCGIRTAGTMDRKSPDVIIIYRGTNDFSHPPYSKITNNYFDNYDWLYPSDDTVTEGYGYMEGLCLTIKKLRDAYPNAKIFLCTLNVFKRVNYAHFPTNNGEVSLPQYNEAIRKVANYMGCGLIEFDKDGITFENCYSEGYITDSEITPTHPSNKGHLAMGLKAITDIKAQYSSMT